MIADRTDDPLINAGLEEEVLSTMMSGVKVTSLWPEHFTHGLRARMYELMKGGMAYEQLRPTLHAEGICAEDLLYIADVYQCPQIPKGQRMREAVEELRRLHHMRLFVLGVTGWLRRAPGLSLDRAERDLLGVIRMVKKDWPSTDPDTGQPSPAPTALRGPSATLRNGQPSHDGRGGASGITGRLGRPGT